MKPNTYFFLLLCTFGFLSVDAQVTIFAGPQMTTASYSIRDVKQETSHKTGFMGGIGLTRPIEGPAYFSPMLFFSRKGYKVDVDRSAYPPDSGAINNNTTINTIELAPLVQLNFSRQASYGFFRFGPSFDFNLSGKETYDSTTGKQITQDMVFDFGTYSHATVSLHGQLGFQHQKGFTFFAFYSLGLSSLNNADYGPKIFHRVGGIAVGWQFAKKP